MEIAKSEVTAQHTYKALFDTLTHLNKRYHEDSVQEVPDAVYDAIKREFIELETALGIDDPNSPAKTVGSVVTGSNGFATVAHATPMLSLSNVFTLAELHAWIIGVLQPGELYRFELKLDGLSLDLQYKNKYLVKAITRGDGWEGEDVTENATHVFGVPVFLGESATDDLIEVRGEVIVEHYHFEEINAARARAGHKPYANPRNYAAGSLRLKNPEDVFLRKLRFYAYEVEMDWSKYYGQELNLIWTWGFHTVHGETLKLPFTPNSQLQQLGDLLNGNLLSRSILAYDIDGLVFKVHDRNKRTLLGTRSNSPRWAVAYKFQAEEAVGVILDIRWQVGKSGVVTPVATITPTYVAGVTVTSVTLHNVAEIERLGLMIGDHVIVVRRGDVIPKIEKVLIELRTEDAMTVIYPEHCPFCDCELERVTHSLYCPNNTGCPEQSVARLEHFVSRDGMDIRDLGLSGVTELVKHGMVASFSSLFYLNDEDMKLVWPNSEVTRAKVLRNIQAARHRPFRKVIYAVGIPECGEGTASRLAAQFNSFAELCEASVDRLKSIPDIGPITAQSIYDTCQLNRKEYSAYDRLFTYTPDRDIDPTVEKDLLDKRVIVTGSNFNGLSRQQMEAQVKNRGAKLASDVSDRVAIIYVGTGPGPEKLKKAAKLGFIERDGNLINPKQEATP